MLFKKLVLVFLGIGLLNYGLFSEKSVNKFKYHNPKEVNSILKKLVKSNKKFTKLHYLSTSRGGEKVNIFEVGNETDKPLKTKPAILVVANIEGVNLLATEAALYLTKLLIKKSKSLKYTWYIVPMLNPDAMLRYFKNPLFMSNRNKLPVNDDLDDATDEDGFDDLDGNGIITMMRVKDPEGKFVIVKGEPRLMKRADWKKGEKGVYKLYTEGIDNDGDGKYNEDGVGGVDLSKQFPHLYKPFKKDAGQWPGSEKTIFNLFKFVFAHKEIAMTMNFNNTNFLLQIPQGGRRGKADYNKIKIPKRLGKAMGFDTSRTYTMKEIMEKAKEMVPPGMQLTESMVASFLGLGAVVNPIKSDLDFYKIISKEYKEYLKKNKFQPKRFDPKRAKNGSFELWAYYHLGLPSFTMDFWTIPKLEEKKKKSQSMTAEKLGKMSKEEFLALGKKKIQAFLKSSGAPKNIKAEMLIGAVKSGMMTPKKMAKMMKNMQKSKKSKDGISKFDKAYLAYSDKVLHGKGFVNWKFFNHPTLGKVEIGGKVPFTSILPPVDKMENLLNKQVPFVPELTKKLPKIKINKIKIKLLGSGVYSVKAVVENTGLISYPTAMGERNGRITPVIITLSGKGVKILEGKKKARIKVLRGYSKKSVRWLLYSKTPVNISIRTITQNAGNDIKNVRLGGSK